MSMSVYLITREGLEIGSYTTSQIEIGLQTGFFRLSDLGWREMSGWQGLSDIVGSVKASGASSGAAHGDSAGLKPEALNPIAATMPQGQQDGGDGVTPAVIAELSSTWPWLRFISSVMAISCLLLLILAGLALGVNGEGSWWAGLPTQHLGKDSRHLLTAVVGALLTFLILYPALKLRNYANHIARLKQTQSPADLAAALAEQRRVWRFCGILTLLYVSAVLVLFFGSLFATRGH
jgi:hypothetical protein